MLNKKIFFLGLVSVMVLIPLLGWSLTVKKISIKGNRRVGNDAILNQLQVKKNKPLSKKQIRNSIDNIFRLGFFEKIEVHSDEVDDGVALTFWVQEKPAIRKITYAGYSKVGLSDIKEVVQLKEYAILDLNEIQKTKEKIVKLYEQKGFFLAQVKHVLTKDKKKNEVELVFSIEELDKVKIRKINFIGNQVLTDDNLKNVMATKEGGLLSWLTKSDSYQEDVFRGDLEGLTYYYHTKGYVQVNIHQPVITVSPDKKWIYISVAIEEGERFNIGSIDYAGDLIFTKEKIGKEKIIKSEILFNRELLRQEVLRLADLFKDEGYAFANVNVKSTVKEKEKHVDLVFDFEKGQKVYFGKIKFLGNTNTRDKVLRREMKIFEGDLYSETKLRKSIDRLRALGYFNDVSYTKPQGDKLDLLDLNISVSERSTGALTVGAGWSSVDKFVANAQVSHNNLFGKGQAVALNAQLSGGDNGSSRFSASFTEPYTFDTLWTTGFDGYNTETKTQNYTELKKGGDVRVGHPIGEFINTFLTYKLEKISLSNVSPTFTDAIKVLPLTSSILSTVIYDSRNNRFEPTQGVFERFSLEYAGVGGDNNFFKSIFNTRFYFPTFLNGVFRVNGQFGVLLRTTENSVPTTERFILGGVNSLRGYQPFSIGPGENDKDGNFVVVGGNRQFFGNFEYEIPLIRQMGIKGVLFYDLGSAFNGTWVSKVRHDIGFGFRWFSPFGPLRVEVGFPIEPKPGEKKQVLQFAITPPF